MSGTFKRGDLVSVLGKPGVVVNAEGNGDLVVKMSDGRRYGVNVRNHSVVPRVAKTSTEKNEERVDELRESLVREHESKGK